MNTSGFTRHVLRRLAPNFLLAGSTWEAPACPDDTTHALLQRLSVVSICPVSFAERFVIKPELHVACLGLEASIWAGKTLDVSFKSLFVPLELCVCLGLLL